MPTGTQITQLLMAWNRGERQALDQLIPLVYDELHRLADSYLRREPANRTLQSTERRAETEIFPR